MEFLHLLRQKNNERQLLWDPDNILVGPLGKLFRSNELGGELGEALNEVKKLIREELGIKGSRTSLTKLGDELADVIICTDLLAALYNVDLVEAVTRKFNETSDNVGFDVKL